MLVHIYQENIGFDLLLTETLECCPEHFIILYQELNSYRTRRTTSWQLTGHWWSARAYIRVFSLYLRTFKSPIKTVPSRHRLPDAIYKKWITLNSEGNPCCDCSYFIQ